MRESVLPRSYRESLQPYVEVRSFMATEGHPTGETIYRHRTWPDEAGTEFSQDERYQELIEQYVHARQKPRDPDQPDGA